jgi:hypothetical protein
MTDLWMPRLSEYLDGDLPDDQRLALERHLDTCPACTATLEELVRVVARAQSLEERDPATDLWPGIAGRIAAARDADVVDLPARRQRGRFMLSLPQLAAAAVVLMALTAGTTWLVQARLRAPAIAAARPELTPPGRNVLTNAATIPRGYDAAIADLERTLQQERGQLDTGTVRVIEHNLRVIDQAIAQARQALATDPSSVYLNGHLADQMRRKLDLLRRVTTIAQS